MPTVARKHLAAPEPPVVLGDLNQRLPRITDDGLRLSDHDGLVVELRARG